MSVKAYEPKFVALSDLRKHGRLPRNGSTPGFRHPMTGQPNAPELLRPQSSFDKAKTAYAFVSHRWLSPGMGERGHPDNTDNAKFKLLLKMCEKLCGGPNTPVPAGFEVALWLGA